MTTATISLAPLAARGISTRIVGASPSNYGYPRGAEHQTTPQAMGWHITDSVPSPGPNPLAGLDSWFLNPAAGGCTQIGISGRHVHLYCQAHVACYGAGWVEAPDLTNPIIKRWVERGDNPNFWLFQAEVVAKPGPRRVALGERFNIDDETWETMLIVDEELGHKQLGLPRSLEVHIGHGQIDGVSRARDPFNCYDPEDIYLGNSEDSEEEEMADVKALPYTVKGIAREASGRSVDQPTWLIGVGAPVRVSDPIALAGLREKGAVLDEDSIVLKRSELLQLGIKNEDIHPLVK